MLTKNILFDSYLASLHRIKLSMTYALVSDLVTTFYME